MGVRASDGKATVSKEFSGGVMAEYEIDLPAVVGVQAATSTPRYAPISKIRQMSSTAEIEEIEVDEEDAGTGLKMIKMSPPATGGGAEMLSGDAEEVAEKILEILKEGGLL